MEKIQHIIIVLLLSVAFMQIWNTRSIVRQRTQERKELTKYNTAYKAVIHRVWIDNPTYVEEVLWESDEMLHLDELLAGDWDNTFEFWTGQDSIDYITNWEYDPITNSNPDTIPKQAKPDVPTRRVEPIKLTYEL